jgi:GNAT superfamily N-acetyltransferase
MDSRKFGFLNHVLGLDGAKALVKAVERSGVAEPILLPRTIVAWLNYTETSFDGEIPGVDNSYLCFKKSEEKYTGSIAIDDYLYDFNDASIYHLASAMAVALGIDTERSHPNLRDLDLVKLGRSIDLLCKSHCLIEKITEDSLEKSIKKIPAGKPMKDPQAASIPVFDYSHVLSPQHRKMGYSMRVRFRPDSGTVTGHVYKSGLEVGQVKGVHEGEDLRIEDAEVQEPHQGKGLGSALYEGLMAHGHHSGIKTVSGWVHSTSASKVHQRLSQKHGMEYKQVPTQHPALASPTPGPYDNRHGSYSYAIKEEIPANKAEGPGPAHLAIPPEEQGAPTPPTMQTAKAPKKPKLPKKITITKSQAEKRCEFCDLPQFKGDKFNACLCFRDLKKHTKTELVGDKYVVELGDEWDEESISCLLEVLG